MPRPKMVGIVGAWAALLGCLGVLLASSAVGARLPAVATLPLSSSRFSSNPLTLELEDGVSTLRSQFLEQVLGADAARLLGTAPLAPSPAAASPARRPEVTTSGTTTTTTAPRPSGGRVLPPLPSEADLAITMTADRRTVRPGESIRYVITLTNIGDKPFVGDVEIRSHIPFGTSHVDDVCGGVGPAQGCFGEAPAGPPGPPTEDVHTVIIGYTFTDSDGMEPGRSETAELRVRVNETTRAGTELSNHAHLFIVGSNAPPETTDTVVVRVT